jgi:hypothetical protein
LTTSSILWGLLFGSLGTGFFVYGKKQKAVVPLLCGLGLMAVVPLVSNTYAMVSVGAALSAIPFVFRP